MSYFGRLPQHSTMGHRELFYLTILFVIVLLFWYLHIDSAWMQGRIAVSERTDTTTGKDMPELNTTEVLRNQTVFAETRENERHNNLFVFSTLPEVTEFDKDTNSEDEEETLKMEISSIEQAVQDKMLFPEQKIINPHRFKYIHNVPDACQGTKVELLIGVHTKTDSFESRNAIRETWGQLRENPEKRTVTVFFLGTTSDHQIQDKIDKEALEYSDIVQEDFLDTYRNLSLKSVALFRWVSLYCPNSTFVLKADEDVYINVPALISALHRYYRLSRLFIIGQLRFDDLPERNSTGKFSRYYLSYEEYPFDTLPSFVSGTAYAMTTTAAMKLYIESFYVSPIFLEDVYLTGIVADRAAIPKFLHKGFKAIETHPDGRAFNGDISRHYSSAAEIREVHKQVMTEG